MSQHRTRAQREANELDRVIFTLSQRMETFAELYVDGRQDKAGLLADAGMLRQARTAVRRVMHPADREGTA